MSADITVFLESGKTFSVKTETTTALIHILNAVCKQLGYPDPEAYGLKVGNKFLDLSASIGAITVAPGSKLELVKRRDPSAIDVVLELEEVKCSAQSFSGSTSLWDVLQGFEELSNGSLNLTRRTGIPPLNAKNVLTLHRRLSKKGRTASKVYMMPVAIVQEQEYSTIQTLRETTLEQADAGSGSINIRISMRYTTSGIDKYIDEIEGTVPQDTDSTPQDQASSSETEPTSPMTPLSPMTPMFEVPEEVHGVRRNRSDRKARTFPLPSSAYGQGRSSGISGMLGRIGTVKGNRNNHHGGPGKDPSSGDPAGDNGVPRQTTAVQDLSTAMIEANQEIRQLHEQQTQEAMTDRVKRISKSNDGTDRERFLRGIPENEIPLIIPPFVPLPTPEVSVSTFTAESLAMASQEVQPSPAVPAFVPSPARPHDDFVQMIAHRVSQQMRDAQQRGESTADYHSLIAREIAKGQQAGVLPISQADSYLPLNVVCG
ncbi:MAG: hypothetical protein J3Q66DRAFT_391078 [Benniella sp.]|nr:MAG: hypothetical protein J3Q66DRAFT_391078 [Benniella sp.]